MELDTVVKKLFEDCREYCREVTNENTIENNREYKHKLETLKSIWELHDKRMRELLTKAIEKCDRNIEQMTRWRTS